MLFPGWTDETVLKMNAKRFFALLHHGRDIRMRRHVDELCDLTDIAAVSLANHEYVKELKGCFRAMIAEPKEPIPGEPKVFGARRGLDPADPRTSKVLMGMFKTLGKQ